MTPEPRGITPGPKAFSRRQLLKGAGAGGIAAALVPVLRQSHGPWTAWPVSNPPLPPALMALQSRCI